MISVRCECGKRLNTKDRNAGQKIACPYCGAVVVFPGPPPVSLGAIEQEVGFGLVDQDRSPAEPPVGPRVVPPPDRPGIRESQTVLFYFLAFMFFWNGFASLWDYRYFNAESSSAHRFKTDNATGAAANALEYIADTPHPRDRGVWVLAGLLCVLIVKVNGLRWSLDRVHRQE